MSKYVRHLESELKRLERAAETLERQVSDLKYDLARERSYSKDANALREKLNALQAPSQIRVLIQGNWQIIQFASPEDADKAFASASRQLNNEATHVAIGPKNIFPKELVGEIRLGA